MYDSFSPDSNTSLTGKSNSDLARRRQRVIFAFGVGGHIDCETHRRVFVLIFEMMYLWMRFLRSAGTAPWLKLKQTVCNRPIEVIKCLSASLEWLDNNGTTRAKTDAHRLIVWFIIVSGSRVAFCWGKNVFRNEEGNQYRNHFHSQYSYLSPHEILNLLFSFKIK